MFSKTTNALAVQAGAILSLKNVFALPRSSTLDNLLTQDFSLLAQL